MCPVRGGPKEEGPRREGLERGGPKTDVAKRGISRNQRALEFPRGG